MRSIFIVLPAFNEEARIRQLIERIAFAMAEGMIEKYRILVVDDGSKDKTASIVQGLSSSLPISLHSREENLGLGATLREGLIEASKLAEGEDIILTMDADDTHAPGLILRMTRMIREGHDVVIASRYREGSRVVGLSYFRRFLSFVASWVFRVLFPTPGVRDYTCGYRAYRAEVIKKALDRYGQEFIDQGGFQCMVDIILKLRKMNVIFGEVPFILRYDYKEGDSKMNVFKTVKNTLLLAAKRRLGG